VKRRAFIALGGSMAALPLAARAQPQPAKPIIGFLRAGHPPKPWIDAFQQGLRQWGYVDGQNVIVEFRFTDGSVDQLPQLAEDLVRLRPAAILASAAPAALTTKRATTSVPIIFVVSNPVEMGLVPSLATPGGNVTGLALASVLAGKRLELLRELVPTLRRVVVLWDRDNPNNPVQLEDAQAAARALGMQPEPVAVRGPNDFDSGFSRGTEGLLVLDSSLFTTYRAQFIALAAERRLPVVYGYREMVEIGGLMSYGSDIPDLYKRSATYVDKILKGAKPADLPVEEPTKYELVINLKTAKALGLTVPPTLLARADEVIE
jgi:putative tryptophan/tyrosine transport system substrate-binding protein